MALDDESTDDGETQQMNAWDRFTGTISNFMLKPRVTDSSDEESPKQPDSEPKTVAEIEAAIKRANDKERAIGLIAAPVAAAIALLVVSALVSHDPAALYSNGQINPKHVRPSLYEELGAVTLGLSLLMLAAAWFRKRLLLGISMALYGLSIFNLHYWGFGVPFLLAGSWYLVRAWRLNSKLKAAGGGSGRSYGPPNSKVTNRLPSAGGVLPRPNKRYTPATAKTKRPAKTKPQR